MVEHFLRQYPCDFALHLSFYQILARPEYKQAPVQPPRLSFRGAPRPLTSRLRASTSYRIFSVSPCWLR